MKRLAKHIGILKHLDEFQFKRWLDNHAVEVLAEAGIKEGHMVLDFGCGSGTYTIPAAKLVGIDGRIYALDMDSRALDKMQGKANLEGLENIVRIDASGEEEIPLENGSVDAVLLIDVLKDVNNKESLFNEAHRVLRPSGNLIVFPMHMAVEEVEKLAANKGFKMNERKIQERIIVFGKAPEA